MRNSPLLITIALILVNCSNRSSNNTESLNGTLKKFADAENISPSWSKENIVIAHVISEPENLHPTNGGSSPRSEILQYTQRTLLYVDYKTQTLAPALVKSLPEISADGLQYTYTLRDDVKWDDGNKLSVDDIIFTAKAFKCPLTNDASVRLYWENVDDIRAETSPGQFTILMKKKYVQNISFLTSFAILEKSFHDPGNILSAFSLKQFGDTTFETSANTALVSWAKEFNDDKYGRDAEKLNGLGMYKVVQWETGQYITLVKKKNHWTEQSKDYHEVSYPEKIIFKLNKDEASQLLQFKAQETDASVNLSLNSFIQLSADSAQTKNYNLALMPTYNYTYIAFNEKPDGAKRQKLFDDVRVRKAISLLTPVGNLIKVVYKQYSSQCQRMISNVSPLKKEFDQTLNALPFDPTAAEKLLNDAGWNDSDKDGILDKTIDEKKVDLVADLNYMNSTTDWRDMALLIAEEFGKAGIKINPVSMDLKLFVEKAKAHDFDLILGSLGGTALQEDYTQLWHTSSWTNHGSNYAGYGSDETDALIDSIKHELNDSARMVLSHELQKKIYDDHPFVFLYCSLRKNIVHRRFGNQMIFSERPGLLVNMLRLLSINKGITINDEVTP